MSSREYRERARAAAWVKTKEELIGLFQVICCLLGLWGVFHAVMWHRDQLLYHNVEAGDY